MKKEKDYYVYVYIDPRNFEEFYYGKGKGNRKDMHLFDETDSEKAKRIREIKKENLTPIIRVIARGLDESEALLIEKTLIWKLGRSLANKSSGHFAEKFRPHNKMHLKLNGFDYHNGIYFVNVGEGETRNWDDCRQYGFLSAGQGPKYSNPIRSLSIGDIVAAYLKGRGFVGIGKVTQEAVPVNDFRFEGRSLHQNKIIQPNIFRHSDNSNCEYLVGIEWIKSFERDKAKFKSKSGLYTPESIKASLEKQTITLKYLEEQFSVNIDDLLS